MGKEEKERKVVTKKELDILKKEIEQKGKEIEQLKITMEELRTQIQGKEENAELIKTFEDISELLDVGLSIFSASGKVKGEKSRSKGLFGLINDLATLAEKSGTTYKRRINIGERGIIDLHISSYPIRKTYTVRPTTRLSVSEFTKSTSPTSLQIPMISRSIDEVAVEIFEEEDWLTVITEVRGVKENEIHLSVDENTLTISIDNAEKEYCKKVKLPSAVTKDTVESSYKNGVLKIKLKKIKNTGKAEKR